MPQIPMALPSSPSSPNGRIRFLSAFDGIASDRPPFWYMRQAGRYLPEYRQLRQAEPDFLRFCYTPALTVEAALQPLRRFGMDAAIVFSDILVIPHALGMDVRFEEGRGPLLSPLRDEQDLGGLRQDAVDEGLAQVFASVEGLRRDIGEEVALIGFAGAPWTLAVYMIEGRGGTDGAQARTWARSAPRSFERLMALLVGAVSLSLIRQIERGADAVQLFDSWAGLLAETQFARWVIGPTRAIVAAVKERFPRVPVIGFPRGAGVLYGSYARDTGVDGVGLDASVPLAWARDTIQNRCLVQGNLDPILVKVGGEELSVETTRILASLAPGRFIFNLGHGIVPETPVDHVARVSDLVRSWTPRA